MKSMMPDNCPHCGSDVIYDPNPRTGGLPYCDDCGEDIIKFSQYSRKGLSEMRPYVKGENLEKISVSKEDDPTNDMGMIARNPENHSDQWYVARKYFEDNLALVKELCPFENILQTQWDLRVDIYNGLSDEKKAELVAQAEYAITLLKGIKKAGTR